MIVWRGIGFVALLIPALIMVGGQALIEKVMGARFVDAHPLIGPAQFALAGVLVWLIGAALNNARRRTRVDPETGETALRPRRHTFFFLPVEWFGIALLVVASVSFVSVMMN